MTTSRRWAGPGSVVALLAAMALLAVGCAAPGTASARMAARAGTAQEAATAPASAHPATAVTLHARVQHGLATRIARGPSLPTCGPATAAPASPAVPGQERCVRPAPLPTRFRCPRSYSHKLFPCRLG
jgi:hypothetical protein